MSNTEVMSKHKENQWSNYALRIVLNTASHPFEYAKILIQIGHEPIAPRPSKTFFGNPTLKLPNIFQYVKHIKTVDGFTGLYTGLAPKMCGNLLSAIAVQKCTDYLKPLELEELECEEDGTEETRKQKWLASLKCDLINHTAAIVISQPFHVITIRMMAQFVGKETKYMGIFGSVKEIYRQNGILGFFSGLVPRLLGDVLSLLLAGGLTYTINRYLVEKELKVYIATTMNFISTTVMYPFQVVSTCMAVSNSGLLVGSPPSMPHYKSWVECWVNLSRHQQLKRGSSLLVRYYTGPSITVGGRLLPITENQVL
ncbi:mitochondrial carrier homolog 2-like [Euwallacea similis]|uniref:mitochondrial carrier homolog 2-like n=1 Tax=Euwallacea similis TaxID=1736056 RepID=UPI00344DC735